MFVDLECVNFNEDLDIIDDRIFEPGFGPSTSEIDGDDEYEELRQAAIEKAKENLIQGKRKCLEEKYKAKGYSDLIIKKHFETFSKNYFRIKKVKFIAFEAGVEVDEYIYVYAFKRAAYNDLYSYLLVMEKRPESYALKYVEAYMEVFEKLLPCSEKELFYILYGSIETPGDFNKPDWSAIDKERFMDLYANIYSKEIMKGYSKDKAEEIAVEYVKTYLENIFRNKASEDEAIAIANATVLNRLDFSKGCMYKAAYLKYKETDESDTRADEFAKQICKGKNESFAFCYAREFAARESLGHDEEKIEAYVSMLLSLRPYKFDEKLFEIYIDKVPKGCTGDQAMIYIFLMINNVDDKSIDKFLSKYNLLVSQGLNPKMAMNYINLLLIEKDEDYVKRSMQKFNLLCCNGYSDNKILECSRKYHKFLDREDYEHVLNDYIKRNEVWQLADRIMRPNRIIEPGSEAPNKIQKLSEDKN